MPIAPAFRRWRQKDCEFGVRLGYIARPYLKKTKTKAKNEILFCLKATVCISLGKKVKI
jgi:hypothetical protein